MREVLDEKARLVDALAAVEQALAEAEDESGLLDQVCSTLVDDAGYRFVWIGYAKDDEQRTIEPVAYAGAEQGYLDKVPTSWNGDRAGIGPIGRCIRERRTVVADLDDPEVLHPAPDEARKRGFHSAAAFFLDLGPGPGGALKVYAAEPKGFGDEETDVLARIANDLAHGVCRMRRQKQDHDALVAVRESEARLRSILVAIPDTLYRVTADGTIVGYYPGDGTLDLGPPDTILGKRLDDVFPARLAARIQETIEETVHTQSITVQEHDLDMHGERHWSEARIIPYGPKEVLLMVRDLTEARRAAETEAKAREDKARLERLEEMNEFRTTFVNMAAHELNTPLTPLALQLDLLRGGRYGDLTDKQYDALGLLDRNLTRMSLLVQDMLDATRLQSDRLKLLRADVDLDTIVHEMAETFREPARLEQISISEHRTGSLLMKADPRRIQQVVSNLLSNAIKFTPEGGAVTVTTERLDDHVRIAVMDTGPGLSADQIAKLFEPFVQVHQKPPKGRRGTGLGLYISRGIVEQHGGTIEVTSDGPGKGSTFAFTLPTDGPEEDPEEDPDSREDQGGA